MLRIAIACFVFLIANIGFAQEQETDTVKKPRKSLRGVKSTEKKATIDQYRIVTIDRDTTFADTSLTIASEYRSNYLRKDLFGLLSYPNEGHTYNTLDYGRRILEPYPDAGYTAKSFAWMRPEDIKYYSVATPFTELYYKSVLEQGQILDAFLTANITPRLNLSVAYKGLRSLGKYINELASNGNFRMTGSYTAMEGRYIANAHFVSQDFRNGENGGLMNVNDFLSENPDFENRARLNVYFRDAESFLRGKRLFLDHSFRVNRSDAQNNLIITHRFNYERKFYEWNQPTITTDLDDGPIIVRFGESYVTAAINDQSHYNRMQNRIGAIYENKTLGRFQFFAEDFRYNFYFGRVLLIDGQRIPNLLSDEIQSLGGQYEYRKGKWQAIGTFVNAMTDQSLTSIEGKLRFDWNERNHFSFVYQRMNKLPDHQYNLNQSSYVSYNWSNNFNNEKINNISVEANTQWVSLSAKIASYRDLLYYSNDDTSGLLQLVSPKQYGETINYLSVKASKEFKVWKLALDNTILYQKVDQQADILNVPEFTTRNTLYFSDHFFKKALYVQTGVIFNYFTKYYANDYNPVLGEFFVQNQREVGEFPMLDFFVNAKIRTFRLFVKCEHFNSAWTGNNYLSSPSMPYRDFVLRFGLEWNFFQ